jgi:hypothetical protein
MDGGFDAQTIRLEGNTGSRTVSHIIVSYAGPACIGVCIEEPFAGQFASVRALFPVPGAAVLACELAGLPRSAINLSKLKLHATGKGQRQDAEGAGCRESDVDLKDGEDYAQLDGGQAGLAILILAGL